MNNLLVAVSLALANNRRCVVHTCDLDAAVTALKTVVSSADLEAVEVDLKSLLDQNDSLLSSLTTQVSGKRWLRDVLIWRSVEQCTAEQQRQLVGILDQLDGYDTNAHRICPRDTIQIQGQDVFLPVFHTVIMVVEVSGFENGISAAGSMLPTWYKRLKEKFWFSHFYTQDGQDEPRSLQMVDYSKELLKVRSRIPCVHLSHEIMDYIHSLMVFIRNHRLQSLAPLQTRLSTDTIDHVSLLARSIVAWSRRTDSGSNTSLYVTPEVCQVAMRKIGYWLVDWQIPGGLFDLSARVPTGKDTEEQLENNRKLVVNMLAGAWYGSEWPYVKEYIQQHEARFDPTSNTGYSNSMIEDSISAVQPPM
ncbi:hypothetical protein CANTEDRAFT_114419 [Yamadazyma tenuis ATCC 10573]|uniref:Uncharacterized protein n=1 Tax=Candida tenuis (strain ATCC 10573 / BCRC 21748 / CBS 615 / JCM 9827 / NBRC 10315 / NRRL Y-1498 / VKM Y-70) TaxID=590646 RepID=G3B758_CANTC|nr:uncharacterized protein CANTEDRAFT_114419 [Yamadazyma tenuis ATCC 10573]EGV63106.1 hypothetical protein CANTEDRAFT_114419 [Yamadazyma tenuis ATCC 10573]